DHPSESGLSGWPVISPPRRLGLRPENDTSGACLTMPGRLGWCGGRCESTTDIVVIRTTGDETVPTRIGAPAVPFSTWRSGLAASRRGGDMTGRRGRPRVNAGILHTPIPAERAEGAGAGGR